MNVLAEAATLESLGQRVVATDTLEFLWNLPTARELERAEEPTLVARSAIGHEAVERLVASRLQAARLGAAALHEVAAPEQAEASHAAASTYDALVGAGHGNERDAQAAKLNIKTLISEVTQKYKNAVEVEGRLDALGRFWQFGQTSDDFIHNTLRYVGDNPTTVAEGKSIFRFEELVRHNLLQVGEQYNELSRVPLGERKELADRGYFLDSMSFVARSLTLHEGGKVTIRSNFIAGVDMEALAAECGSDLDEAASIARQERALTMRHDAELITEFYRREHLPLIDASAEGMLGSAFITDGRDPSVVVRKLDAIAAKLLGKLQVFYGVDGVGDYDTFVQDCAARAQRFDAMADEILMHAIQQVQGGAITSAGDVPNALRALVTERLVERAIHTQDIDLRIFGVAAPVYILDARERLLRGDLEGARQVTEKAIEYSDVKDCPGGKNDTADANKQSGDAKTVQDTGKEKKKSNEACTYSGTFCYCCPFNDDGTKASSLREVTISRDSNGIATCTRTGCGAAIDGKSKVLRKGGIYKKHMWLAAMRTPKT